MPALTDSMVKLTVRTAALDASQAEKLERMNALIAVVEGLVRRTQQ